jgi:2-amino-4-hydroxy-6-hydroxymethyldihydropteridine diphosphokinase
VSAWIGLGANLGDARAALRSAVQAMAALPGTRLLRVSSLYRSAPVDAGGPITSMPWPSWTPRWPLELLHALQRIEQAAGRERPYRNAPRTLDLDLLLYGTLRLDSAELTVPHPRMGERAFVLLPWRNWPAAGGCAATRRRGRPAHGVRGDGAAVAAKLIAVRACHLAFMNGKHLINAIHQA